MDTADLLEDEGIVRDLDAGQHDISAADLAGAGQHGLSAGAGQHDLPGAREHDLSPTGTG